MNQAASNTLEKVASEFEAEVLADLRGGLSQALGSIASTKSEAKEAVAKIIEGSVKQADSLRRQALGAAELEVRNGQLTSLERAVNDVFDTAVKRLSGMSGAKYEKALSQLIREGVDAIGPKAKVRCSSKDRRAVAAATRKLSTGPVRLTFDDKPVETIGGVVMTTADGLVKFDNTFEARLLRMKPELRKEAAGLLTA